MLKRAMQTAAWFDPDEYDIKHIRFLNEINAAVGYLMSLYFGRTWFIHCSDDRFVKEWLMTRFNKNTQESFLPDAPISSIIVIQALVENHTLASLDLFRVMSLALIIIPDV